MGFSRQEYWSGLPFSSPGDLPDPGIEHASPALAGWFFTTEPLGKPLDSSNIYQKARPEVHDQGVTLKHLSAAFLTPPNPFRERPAFHGKVWVLRLETFKDSQGWGAFTLGLSSAHGTWLHSSGSLDGGFVPTIGLRWWDFLSVILFECNIIEHSN